MPPESQYRSNHGYEVRSAIKESISEAKLQREFEEFKALLKPNESLQPIWGGGFFIITKTKRSDKIYFPSELSVRHSGYYMDKLKEFRSWA